MDSDDSKIIEAYHRFNFICAFADFVDLHSTITPRELDTMLGIDTAESVILVVVTDDSNGLEVLVAAAG